MVQSMRQNIILEESRQQILYTSQAKSDPIAKSGLQNSDTNRSPRHTICSPPTGDTSVRSLSATVPYSSANDSTSNKVLLSSAKRNFKTSKVKGSYSQETKSAAAQLQRSKSPCVSSHIATPSPRGREASNQKAISARKATSVDSGRAHSPSAGRSSSMSRSMRSQSSECSRTRAPFTMFLRPWSSPVRYTSIGRAHTQNVPNAPKCTPYKSSNKGRSSRCDTASSRCETPSSEIIKFNDILSAMLTCVDSTSVDKELSNEQVEQMMSQADHTLKIAPGCHRGEASIPTTWSPDSDLQKMFYDTGTLCMQLEIQHSACSCLLQP